MHINSGSGASKPTVRPAAPHEDRHGHGPSARARVHKAEEPHVGRQGHAMRDAAKAAPESGGPTLREAAKAAREHEGPTLREAAKAAMLPEGHAMRDAARAAILGADTVQSSAPKAPTSKLSLPTTARPRME